MIDLGDGCSLVNAASELPAIKGVKRLYADFETRSGDRKRSGDNPWAGDRIAGAAVTWDDHSRAYYVPVRHNGLGPPNLPVDCFQRWLRDAVETCEEWVNHNVKFDAHFAAADGAIFRGRLTDTLTLAKMIDSDRGFGRGGYGLDALSSDWLDEDIDSHDQSVQAFLKGMRPQSKDYADCPSDLMGRYACQDVLTARRLHLHCLDEATTWAAKVPRFADIWETEKLLTPVLWDMEQSGLRVDPGELQMKQFRLLTEMHAIQEELHCVTGYPVEPSNSGDCYELVCNRLGLPVIAWTDERRPDADHNPCFDKIALADYLQHPLVVESEKMQRIFDLMLRFRKRHTLLTFFVEPYLARQVGGILHPQYNQLVRTGRMSSKQPNAQQLNKEAKELVHPDHDTALLSCDASQIEFRLICHYSRDAGPLAAYAADPDTDFHAWVAGMCGVTRPPAKTINFCMGYGGGKEKVLLLLSKNMALVGTMMREVDKLIAEGRLDKSQRNAAFEALARARAEEVYRTYHGRLPGIKGVTRRAALLVKASGYVFSESGRVRRLPERAAWRALNSVTQGLASDIIKIGMVRVAPRYCAWTRDAGMELKANVHDEVLSQWPLEALQDPRTTARLVSELEEVPFPLRVPIRFGAGVSATHWREASSDGAKLTVDRTLARGVA